MLDFPNAPTVDETFPEPPVEGLPVWRWTGAMWARVGVEAGGASVTIDAAPPPDSNAGDLWWQNTTGRLFVWYEDGGSGSQWVEISVSAGGGGAVGEAPEDGELYGRRDGAWSSISIPETPEDTSVVPVGGRLRIVGASPSFQLGYFPFNGGWIRIAGKDYAIPANGVRASPSNAFVSGVPGQALANGAAYLVYIFDNAGTLTLDFRTGAGNGHTTDTTPGNVGTEIRQGDPTRTLVGMVYLQNNAFYDDLQYRYVRSWLNRVNAVCTATTNWSTGGAASWWGAGLAGTARFVAWAGESVFMVATGHANSVDNTSNNYWGILNPAGAAVVQHTWTGTPVQNTAASIAFAVPQDDWFSYQMGLYCTIGAITASGRINAIVG